MGCGSSQSADPGAKRFAGSDSSGAVETDITYIHANSSVSANLPKRDTLKLPPLTKTTDSRRSESPSSAKPNEIKVEPILIESFEDESDAPDPTVKKKKDLIPDPAIFKEIDNHVAKTPKTACSSTTTLASYLVQPAKTTFEKLRALHKWVTTNVRYDTEGFFGGDKKPCDAESVLKNRTAVCQGYSELFAALCRAVHIQVKIIQGYGKGYGYNPETTIDVNNIQTNHAWNAVLLDKEWRLVDCTWDAGTVDANRNFNWRKGDHYFLTDPEVFVNTHFPLMKGDYNISKQWQLLNRPLDASTFFKRLKLNIFAFESGLELVSHKDTLINAEKEIEIFIRRYDGVYNSISAHLEDAEEGINYDQYIFITRKNKNGVLIRVRAPKVSTFTLKMFGRIGEEEKQHNSLCDYYLKFQSAVSDALPYPKHFGIWGPKPNYMECGFASEVGDKVQYESNNGEVDIKLPTTREVSVLCRLELPDGTEVQGAVFVQATASGDILLSVRMPAEGYYRLLVFAPDSFGKQKDVIYYMLYCKKAPTNYSPFPTSYLRQTRDLQTLLLEPRTKTLPANSDVTFRFSSKLVEHVQIFSKVYRDEKDGDIWNITLTTPGPGKDLTIFGGKKGEGGQCLYTFQIV